MEDLFGQIECRSRSDLIVMRILRSAMDKAHEKLQSKDGPIEFLHERSTFYQLAAILVEGGLNIVQEETEILEENGNKVLLDLMEIKNWLEGRIQDMKQLIVDKDSELTEHFENESKLREALELKDRENNIHDSPISHQGDIFKLKNSVDQQVWSIKQKLEDEKKILTTERRTRKSRLSSPNLSFDFLDRERNESSVFTEDIGNDRFSILKPPSSPNQNMLIRRMSSDIDVLKETLDLAFGRMQSNETLPMEKQWRWTIERDIESVLVKGFISDLQRNFDVELDKKVGLLKDNWFEFINEMKALCHELKHLFTRDDVHEKGSSLQGSTNPSSVVRRTASEPLLEISYEENLLEEDNGDDGRHHVAKMIKNHESIIRKQRKERNWPTREELQREGSSSSWIKREKDNNELERRIQDAITRLDNFTERNQKLANQRGDGDGNCSQEKRMIPKSDIKTNRTVERLEGEIEKLKEEKDGLCFYNSLMEDTYQLLFQGMMGDIISTDLSNTERLMKNDSGEHATNKFSHEELPSDDLWESLGSQLKEDTYMVYFKEMAGAWKSELDACPFESLIREDIYQFIVFEAVKDSQTVLLKESVAQKQLDFQECTPRSRKLNIADIQEGTPRSRILEAKGEEGLIQKLDSLLKCLEAEEDLMLRASSEIKEHTVNNSLVILNCEEMDERNAIEWLITDDESTFCSVSEKLERALLQLYTSKELLMDLEQSLEVAEDLGEHYQLKNIHSIEHEKLNSFPFDDCVLAIVTQFQKETRNVERVLYENLETKCLRLEILKRQINTLSGPVALMRTRKLLYKKAFISRCHNLKLAETEVDLLADQVESLLGLLERIYVQLNQNATVFSCYFEVYDILKLIKRELNVGRRSFQPES